MCVSLYNISFHCLHWICMSHCFSVFHLVSLQLFSHFIHVPIILRYQRSHYTVTHMNNDVTCVTKKKYLLSSSLTSTEGCYPHNKNVLTVVKERHLSRLTFCLRSRVQETLPVLPPQPDEHKGGRGIMRCPVSFTNKTKYRWNSCGEQSLH